MPLYAAVLVLTHLTGFQQAMSQHAWIHNSELVLYLVAGYLLLLPLVGDELTTDPPLGHLLRFVILAICMGPDTLVGIVLMMTSTALAPAYAASRDWGPSAVVDQGMAGAIMWFAGDGLMMILMVVIGGRWIARPRRSGCQSRTLAGPRPPASDPRKRRRRLDRPGRRRSCPGRLQRSPRRAEPPTTRRTSAVTR